MSSSDFNDAVAIIAAASRGLGPHIAVALGEQVGS